MSSPIRTRTHRDVPRVPRHDSRRADATSFIVTRILQWRQDPGPGARGRRVEAAGRLLPERFVGPDVVLPMAKRVKPSLLARQVARGGPRRFGFERSMHTLVRAVLIGRGRGDEHGGDPQPNPPDREARQPSERGRGERLTVVRADRLRQPVPPEQLAKSAGGAAGRRGTQALTTQHEATEGIADRQRIAQAPIPRYGTAL